MLKVNMDWLSQGLFVHDIDIMKLEPYLEYQEKIHHHLGHLLNKKLSGWLLKERFIENEIISHLELEGTILNPGDQLTLCYIFGEKIRRKGENLLCGQSLLYTKIIHKEEIDDKNRSFPHLRNEISSINLVKSLNLEECRRLFSEISPLSTQQAREAVSNYSANR